MFKFVAVTMSRHWTSLEIGYWDDRSLAGPCHCAEDKTWSRSSTRRSCAMMTKDLVT